MRILLILVLLLWGFAALLWLADSPVLARALMPVQREVVVRVVSNGYVVTLRNTHNPYPAVERVETTAYDAGKAVTVLLKQPFPRPQWGR